MFVRCSLIFFFFASFVCNESVEVGEVEDGTFHPENSDLETMNLDCPAECVCLEAKAKCNHSGISGFEWVNVLGRDIKALDLSYNEIKNIPRGIFRKFHRLRTLSLNNNKITEITSGAFMGLGRLKYLHLQGNSLKTLSPSSFVGLRRIHRLFLHNNSLKGVPSGIFDDLESIKWLRLEKNPLNCDCDLEWLRSWMSEVEDKARIAAVCAAPVPLNGYRVARLRSTDFDCEGLHFLREPTDISVPRGSIVSMKCKVVGDPLEQFNISWTKDGKILDVLHPRYVFHSEGLDILNSNDNDTGIYVCEASSENKEIKSRQAKLKFYRPKKIQTKILKNTVIRGNVGDTLQLECNITLGTDSAIKWSKDKSKLIRNKPNIVIRPNGSLLIMDAKLEDQGLYECEVTEPNGKYALVTVVYIFEKINSKIGDELVDRVMKAINEGISDIVSGQDVPATFKIRRFPSPALRELYTPDEVYEQVVEWVANEEGLSSGADLSESKLNELADLAGCTRLPQREDPDCENEFFYFKYRNIDGTCNNFLRPLWGASMIPYKRNLLPKYEDKLDRPIGWDLEKRQNNFKIPNARKVSLELISNGKVKSGPHHTQMLMQWRQFLHHDLGHTLETTSAQANGRTCTSCEKKAPCFPITIEPGDPRILEQVCIELVRSSPTCQGSLEGFPQRDQVNSITSLIDASQIYGSEITLAGRIRNQSSFWGALRHGPVSEKGQSYLPFDVNREVDCKHEPTESNFGCFLAGDVRANEQLDLLTMHTIWLREHNRIAYHLYNINTNWPNEKLYEEARKIVSAEMQIITYKQWLPVVLGPEGMEMLGDYNGYNDSTDPTISNGFNTAAFRFGHTFVNPFLERIDENLKESVNGHLPWKEAFYAPWRLIQEGGTDPIIRGLFASTSKINLEPEVLNSAVTEEALSLTLDQAAISIQRGRDHGLPSFTLWRKWCKLDEDEITTWNDLSKVIRNNATLIKLRSLYGNPMNIDLWVGGMLEEPLRNAKVGPTFACILVDQFKRLRDGDRLWYENSSTFTPSQLDQLKKTSLSRIICDNSDNIKNVPKNPFLRTDLLVKCYDIPSISLKLWQEN